MSRLYLVRHGQARFFTDDYDRLSETGEEQAAALATHWLRQELVFSHAFSGTLIRQRRTGEVVRDAYIARGREFPELRVLPGLDEYPADDIMDTLLPMLRERESEIEALARDFEEAGEGKERYRTFHRLLEAVMARWIAADYPAEGTDGLLSWARFAGGVRNAFGAIMEQAGPGVSVAVFTSGGPVGISVQTVLGAPDQSAADLNWRVHNGSVTRFTFGGGRVSLDGFNDVGHLAPSLLTYR